MSETGMTRILVSSTQLREMLERQPEVELQLVRSAVPQLATLLAEKARVSMTEIRKRVDEAWREIERTKSDRYGLPDKVREIIKDFLRGECRDEAKILVRDEARDMARIAADEAVAKAMLKLGQDVEKSIGRAKAEVDEYIKDQVEQKFLELLRAGRLQVIPQ
jgi:hypothetical protein